MTFSEQTNTWFDGLVSYCKRHGKYANDLREFTIHSATKKNLAKMHKFICFNWRPAGGHMPKYTPLLLDHVERIWARGFKGEFRFHYSRSRRDSSATKELFSMVQQAIDNAKHDYSQRTWIG